MASPRNADREAALAQIRTAMIEKKLTQAELADAGLRVDEVTRALVATGRTVEEIEALVSGRLREALLRTLPSTR